MDEIKNEIEALKGFIDSDERKAFDAKAFEEERQELLREVDELKKELFWLEVLNGIPQYPNPVSDLFPVVEAKVQGQTQGVSSKGDAGGKQKKPGKGPKEKQGKKVPDRAIDVSRLNLKVGIILEVEVHPDADTLYLEKIDVGEDKPRQIISGLVKHVPLAEMKERMVIVFCNLKPMKMRGIESQGMVMCASDPEKGVEILSPPPSAMIGDPVTCPDFPGDGQGPDDVLNPKKKIWEQIAPDLKTNDAREACYKNKRLFVKNEPILAPSLTDVAVR